MAMTRQHFKAIAAVISNVRNSPDTNHATDAVEIAHKLAGEFRNFNPNFNATLFLKACGVSKEVA
jgi:hypothetical protein